MVLLVVDAQKAIVTSDLYNFDLFIDNVKKLIKTARNNNIEVIFVRHNDEKDKDFTEGADGFEIYEGFKPLTNEVTFDKIANSAFKDTELSEYLAGKGVRTVIISGLQTDYCIDATVKSAFEKGLRVIVPAGSNSTFDNEFMKAEQIYRYYNEFMWDKRYAECMPLEKTVELMEKNCRKDRK